MTVTIPRIRIKLSDGSFLEFQNTAVIEANIIEEISPISTELPISVLTAKLYDADNNFSVFSEDELLAERLEIDAYETLGPVEGAIEHFVGKFYLDDWKVPQEHILEIRAIDVIGVLDTTPFDGHFWSSLTDIGDMLTDVFSGVNFLYSVSDVISSKQLQGWIPSGTRREALQQICFAAGAAVSTARQEGIEIIESPIPYIDKWHELDIGVNDKFMVQPIEKKPLITDIELISHNYEESGESEVIFQKILPVGTYKIVFEKPYYDIEVVGPAYVPDYLVTENGDYLVTENGDKIVTGGEYVYGPNSVFLNVFLEAEITVTGYPWINNQRAYSFTEDGISEYVSKNVLKIDQATLVSDDNAQAVLDRVANYYRQRFKHTMKLLPMAKTRYTSEIYGGNAIYGEAVYGEAFYGEDVIQGDAIYGEAVYGWSTPNVKIGQMASIATPQGTYLRAVFEKARVNLTSGFLVEIDAIGVIRD
jgi:hypothetical protein